MLRTRQALSIKFFLFTITSIFAQFIVPRASAQFSPGNLAVLKVGDGSTALSGSAAALTVVEYTTSGTATGNTVSLPSTGTTKITESGSAASEGQMTLSAEKDRLAIPGYDAVAGTSSVASSSSSSVNREIFTITSANTYSKAAYSSTAYTGNNMRSATAFGTNYFSAGPVGASGLMLFSASPSALQLTTATTNARVIQIFNGQTYFSSNNTLLGVSTLGTGIPVTAGQSATLIAASSNAYGFSVSPDGNTLYIADYTAGIIKYTKTSGTFNLAYTVNATPAFGLAVDYSGTSPVIYATTIEASANTIIKVTDAGASSSASVITTAPANTAFKGITFSPSCYASVAITGASTICSGNSTSFTITGNPTATVNYNINGGSTLSAIIGNNGSVVVNTGVLTTTSPINLVSISTTACSSVALTGTATVTVNPLPATITGTTTICSGLTSSLSDATASGTWSGGSAGVATVNTSGVVSATASGTAVVSYTLSTGCYNTTTVTVNPSPSAITGSAVICNGATSTLNDATSSGTWSSGAIAVATVGSASGILSGMSAGTAIVTYALSTGCNATTIATVNPLPATITGTFAICNGTTTTLGDASTGGTWSSSNTGAATIGTSTGIVTGMATGTSVITYTLSTGCTNTAVVTINALPAAITGTLNVCVGSTVGLSDGTTGGTWSSSNTAIATIGSANGVVAGVAAGTSAITYTLSTGCSSTVIVTVNALPAAIVGTMSICEGSATTLSNTTSGGTWISNNISVATIGSASGIVAGMSSGTSVISYTTPAGCYTTAILTVNGLPANITGTMIVCAGLTTTLGDATTGGTWSNGSANATIGSGTGIVTGITAGTATISYTLATNCMVTAIATVNPNPGSITGTMTVCAGLSATLADATSGGTWSSSNIAIAVVDAGTGIVTGASAGTATITYALSATGCTATTIVTVNPLPSSIAGTATVCIGSATTLNDATAGGTWSSGSANVSVGSATGVVTGISAGTANITYTLSTGCISTKAVTVNALPAAITGITTVCAGLTTTLGDATTGGTWSSSTTSVATIDGLTGVVTGVSAGIATITYALSTGCATTIAVTVNPLPSSITGTVTVCAGYTTTLNDATTGGTWNSSSANASVGSVTGIVTGVSAGTSIITYTLSTGCISTQTVTVNGLPANITGTTTVCAGLTTTLSDATTSGTWTSSATSVTTIGSSTGIVTGISAGMATITYTVSTGCITTATVTVNPLPDAVTGVAFVCEGLTTTLADATTGGTWSSSNAAIASISSAGTVTGASAGTAVITYTLPTGCIITKVVTVNPLPASITGSADVCIGSTIDLTDAVASGTWASSTTAVATVSSTGVVSGLTAGTTIITYSLSTGCTTTHVVSVNALPAAISGTLHVCAGSATVLNDATSGGTWSSGNTTIASVGAVTGIVNGIAAGSTHISYQITTTGCVRVVTVSVNPLPAVISGAGNICLGANAYLNDATAGGTWTSSNTAIVTVEPATGVATSVAAGTATITYTTTGGCITTAGITVNPLPAGITGNVGLCGGASTTLGDLTAGGTWSSNNTAIASVGSSTGVLTGITTGTAIITYTLNTGCITRTIVTVSLTPSAISGNGIVCTGSVAALSDAVSGGTWSDNDTAIATINTTGLITGIGAGTVVVTYSISGCLVTRAFTVSVIPSGITGAGIICSGASATLADSVSGGTWISGNAAIASVNASGVVAGNSVGTTNIVYTVNRACHTALIVTVNPSAPAPQIGTHSGNTQCANTMYQNFGASVPAPAGVQYTWTAENAAIFTVAPDGQYCLVNFHTPGNAVVKLSSELLSSGCISVDSFVTTVSSSTSFVSAVIYSDHELICLDNTSDSYKWGYDDRYTLVATFFTGSSTQDYYVPSLDVANKNYWVITDHSGCQQKSYYNAPSAINSVSVQQQEIKLYPVPTYAKINVELTNVTTADIITAKITDISGRELLTATLFNGKATLDIEKIPAGTYAITVFNGQVRAGTKVFVKN